MYAWLWHRLPAGGLPRALLSAALAGAVLVLLFVVVFPRVEALLPYQDNTVAPATTTTR